MVVVMGVHALGMFVVVVVVGEVAGVVVSGAVVHVLVVVVDSVLVGVVVAVPVGAAWLVVVRVVVVAGVGFLVVLVLMVVDFGVVVDVVVVGQRRVVMVLGLIVAVVGFSAQQVVFLFPLGGLRLIDLTIHINVFLVIWKAVEGSLAETLVSKLALHQWALLSCICIGGAGGLLDGVLHDIIHLHGHPGECACDVEHIETIFQPLFFVELVKGKSQSPLDLLVV